NAGIQQRYHILKADVIDNWADYNKEITVNMEAPIHLAMLFSQYFAEKPEKTAIINVTSGLAFTPMAIAPIYSS
ncbi:SDR family NAD(P)-dependent oxidoreductase, partial [Bacillus haynesii]